MHFPHCIVQFDSMHAAIASTNVHKLPPNSLIFFKFAAKLEKQMHFESYKVVGVFILRKYVCPFLHFPHTLTLIHFPLSLGINGRA